MQINMCLFMFIIFILIKIKFDIDINNDELLIIIWDHNKKKNQHYSVYQCGAKVKLIDISWA